MTRGILARGPTADPASLNTASTNVGTAAWVEFVAALTKGVTAIHYTNGSTGVIRLGVGGSGSEVDTGIYIAPGVSQIIPIELGSGQRLSLRSVSGTISSGIVTAIFLG
jgi:hypothetical protein